MNGWLHLVKLPLFWAVSFFSISFAAQVGVNPGVALELQKCKKLFILHEYEELNRLRQTLSVPDDIWNCVLTSVEEAKKTAWGLLQKPLKSLQRDKEIPPIIVDWLEQIAVFYGIHPKSFHIKVMGPAQIKGNKTLKPSTYTPAFVLYPEYLMRLSHKKELRISFNSNFTIYLHPSFIKHFSKRGAKTLYHEMMHIRTLNGLEHGLIISGIKLFGYDVKKSQKALRLKTFATKLFERNTDLLVALEGPQLADYFFDFYKDQIAQNPSSAKIEDATHFSKGIVFEWVSLIRSLYCGEKLNSDSFQKKVNTLTELQQTSLFPFDKNEEKFLG